MRGVMRRLRGARGTSSRWLSSRPRCCLSRGVLVPRGGARGGADLKTGGAGVLTAADGTTKHARIQTNNTDNEAKQDAEHLIYYRLLVFINTRVAYLGERVPSRGARE